ncbi:hypothetical protein [Streptomyces sp. Inha503]|uniref:hypothetical protein n=1 Tax=Streptomyces sp. Inha503 TaxID=3383314 RepID=UPI0039A3CCA3
MLMRHLVSQRGAMSRRTVLATGLAAASAAAFGAVSPGAVAVPMTDGGGPAGNWFAAAPPSARPKFRWWWPDSLVDPDEISREVDQIADTGFGGAEIAAVHHSIQDKSLLDTAHHGWGSGPWRDGVEAFDRALTPGVPARGETRRLRRIVARLLALPNVVRVAEKTQVGDAPTGLGVTPDVRHATPSTLLNAHRVTAQADFYYLCDGKHSETVKPPVAAIDHDVTLRRTGDGEAVPYALDPWTGEAVRLARYTTEGNDFTLRVTLQPGQALIVALGRPGLFGDRYGGRPHAVATDADEAVFTVRGLAVRAGAAGTYTTRLSQGRTVTTTIASVPETIRPGAWQVEVEDWYPGSSATRTEIVRRTLTLDAPLPWSRIPELADSAGVARYRTAVTLPADWTPAHGAYLELGQVSDTSRVSVNGSRPAPVDRLNPVVDVGPWLRRGENAIEIEVATPLVNRLRVGQPAVFGAVARQPYGLIGPVRLVPYAQAAVD